MFYDPKLVGSYTNCKPNFYKLYDEIIILENNFRCIKPKKKI